MQIKAPAKNIDVLQISSGRNHCQNYVKFLPSGNRNLCILQNYNQTNPGQIYYVCVIMTWYQVYVYFNVCYTLFIATIFWFLRHIWHSNSNI